MKVPHKLRSSILASALAAAFASPLVAQQPASSPNTMEARSAQQSEARLDVRASRLIGMDVRDRDGEKLGNVNDLVLDVANNKVHYMVLSHGGFFGVGDSLFAFPLHAFDLAPDLKHLQVNIDRGELRAAQGFDRNRWPDMSGTNYWQDVDRRYGEQRRIAGQRNPSADQAAVAQRTMPGSATAPVGARLQRASEMMRANVVGADGKRVGQVDDVVIDLKSGAIHYAVLAFDRGWLTQDRLIAMPIGEFNRTARNELQLATTREQLAVAPGFDRRAWPDLNDAQFRSQIDRYRTAQRTAPDAAVLGFGTPPAPVGGSTTDRAPVSSAAPIPDAASGPSTARTEPTPQDAATSSRPLPSDPALQAGPRTEKEVQAQWGPDAKPKAQGSETMSVTSASPSAAENQQQATPTSQTTVGDTASGRLDSALFDRIDADRDGRITREEFDAYNQRQAERTSPASSSGAMEPKGTASTPAAPGATGTTGEPKR